MIILIVILGVCINVLLVKETVNYKTTNMLMQMYVCLYGRVSVTKSMNSSNALWC